MILNRLAAMSGYEVLLRDEMFPSSSTDAKTVSFFKLILVNFVICGVVVRRFGILLCGPDVD